ncbi:MAG: DinB family protein [Terriglobales bacterium]
MPENDEILRIVDQLKRSFEGEAWHGPALLEILEDVDASRAASRPIPGAHTIWELTLHVAAWEDAIMRRLGGEALTLEGESNFPIQKAGEHAWHKAIDGLKRAHQELMEVVSTMPDSRLTELVPGKDYDIYFMLHGAVQHALYHAGQMAILKKVSFGQVLK